MRRDLLQNLYVKKRDVIVSMREATVLRINNCRLSIHVASDVVA